jgi:hypothetical protein
MNPAPEVEMTRKRAARGRPECAAQAATTAALVTLALFLAVVPAGCSGPAATSREPSGVRVTPAVSEDVREQLLDGAVAVLDRLEDYDEESAFAQVFDRLNQWSHAAANAGVPLAANWKPDPLFNSLPERLRVGTSQGALESAVFDAATDVAVLRDQRWLADIASSARGDAVEDLDIAKNLFRWTVRSLAVVSDPPMVATESSPGSRWFLPGEILLAGRASPAQRAWIFLELLRHARLEGVMLATGDPAKGGVRAWIPALVSGGEAWLFEPTYGLPVPGPDGTGVATARQAAADPAILERLSVGERSYPVKAADMAGLSVLVAADPWSLSRRMRAVDEQLVGSRGISLAVDAGAVATRALAALPDGPPGPADGGAGAAASGRRGLWEFPWEVLLRRRQDAGRLQAALARELAVMSVSLAQATGGDAVGGRRSTRIVRPLYAARLREFRGELDGPEGAKAGYLAARPGRQAINEAVKLLPPEQADRMRRLFEQMKEDATYWLGVLTLAEGEPSTAVDYLGRMILDAAPDSTWTDAARVNLAQALIALGRTDDAVACLEADASPQRFGSRLLARELKTGAAP